jgi:hypothetical protein
VIRVIEQPEANSDAAAMAITNEDRHFMVPRPVVKPGSSEARGRARGMKDGRSYPEISAKLREGHEKPVFTGR